MRTLRLVEEVRGFSRACGARGESVALVPTMGYLHEGHISLVRLAKQRADRVVVSIFVNPRQFGPTEDLDAYPRDPERDRSLLEREEADVLFLPEVDEMYPQGYASTVNVEGSLTRGLCGASRPGHFAGVATVVTKLLCACEPDVALFGQKDAQQAAVIRCLIKDLNLPVALEIGPIVREEDGLAMSSRNAYLNAAERAQAPVLKAALDDASTLYVSGERRAESLVGAARARIAKAPLARIDYVELVDAETLEPIRRVEGRSLLALAVFFGSTRLIDNAVLGPPTEDKPCT